MGFKMNDVMKTIVVLIGIGLLVFACKHLVITGLHVYEGYASKAYEEEMVNISKLDHDLIHSMLHNDVCYMCNSSNLKYDK